MLRLNKNAPKINLIKNISYGLSLANSVEFTFDNESNQERRSELEKLYNGVFAALCQSS